MAMDEWFCEKDGVLYYDPPRKHKRPYGAYEEPDKHYSHVEGRCGKKCIPFCSHCVHFRLDVEVEHPHDEWCMLRNEWTDAVDMCDRFLCFLKGKKKA